MFNMGSTLQHKRGGWAGQTDALQLGKKRECKGAFSGVWAKSDCNFLAVTVRLARKEIKRSGFPASALDWGELESMRYECGIRTVQDFCVA